HFHLPACRLRTAWSGAVVRAPLGVHNSGPIRPARQPTVPLRAPESEARPFRGELERGPRRTPGCSRYDAREAGRTIGCFSRDAPMSSPRSGDVTGGRENRAAGPPPAGPNGGQTGAAAGSPGPDARTQPLGPSHSGGVALRGHSFRGGYFRTRKVGRPAGLRP